MYLNTLLQMNDAGPLVAVIVIIAIVVAVLVSIVKIVPQATAQVIERLGTYHKTWHTGIHFKAPIIDRIAMKITLMEQVVDFQPHEKFYIKK